MEGEEAPEAILLCRKETVLGERTLWPGAHGSGFMEGGKLALKEWRWVSREGAPGGGSRSVEAGVRAVCPGNNSAVWSEWEVHAETGSC